MKKTAVITPKNMKYPFISILKIIKSSRLSVVSEVQRQTPRKKPVQEESSETMLKKIYSHQSINFCCLEWRQKLKNLQKESKSIHSGEKKECYLL